MQIQLLLTPAFSKELEASRQRNRKTRKRKILKKDLTQFVTEMGKKIRGIDLIESRKHRQKSQPVSMSCFLNCKNPERILKES